MSVKSSQASCHILVADDDPAILRLLSAAIEKEGCTAVLAPDGREAHKILQKNRNLTAAILDIKMPHMSGLELVRYMKKEPDLKSIPVMIMTGERDPKLSSEGLAAGAVFFLPKPFKATQLQMMLRMLLSAGSS